MKNILLILSLALCVGYVFAAPNPATLATNANVAKAMTEYHTEMGSIKQKLSSGKMKAAQSLVLLSAIQVRQNQVIIAQNQKIINLLQAGSK